MLRDDITFLNHGSFGAVPRCAFEEQETWRRRIEAEPVELLWRSYPENLARAKAAVGQFLRMLPADFGFVTNATGGVNAVLRSLSFAPGDELLTTSHVYNAVRQTMRYIAGRAGAAYREVAIPTPVGGPGQIVDAIASALTDRTRLLVIDHVTSPTALVFPVEKIVAACNARGIDVLIDGAHAPGMLDLDVPAIGAAYYTGNLHKWCCAPKGAAFLHVRPDRQREIHPNTISHDLGEPFPHEFDWQGTRDITPVLAAPRALRFLAELGHDNIRRHNHAMATWANRFLCGRWNTVPLSPLDGSLLGSMATVELPPPLSAMSDEQARAFQRSLYANHRIEVPFVVWQGRCHIRVSCHVYNAPADYERLAEVIGGLGGR